MPAFARGTIFSTATRGALLVLLALLAASCATIGTQPETLAFIVVRHAEKAKDGSRDPPLTATGEDRAQRLARMLRGRPLAAAYATGFRRTQDTAAPAAAMHAIAVTAYDAEQPADDFVAQLRREHHDGTVLVVGHSNTVPGIVSALCGCPIAPIDESDYGNLFEVRVEGDGPPMLSHRRF